MGIKHSFGFTDAFREYIKDSYRIDSSEISDKYSEEWRTKTNEFNKKHSNKFNAQTTYANRYKYWEDPEYIKMNDDIREFYDQLKEEVRKKYEAIGIDVNL